MGEKVTVRDYYIESTSTDFRYVLAYIVELGYGDLECDYTYTFSKNRMLFITLIDGDDLIVTVDALPVGQIHLENPYGELIRDITFIAREPLDDKVKEWLETTLHTYNPRLPEEPQEETRITSSTGGQKGDKLCKIGDIDPGALKTLGEVAGFGAEKYDSYNYLKGFDWSLSFNAMQRHMMAFWAGEDLDPESGKPHMAHAAWHALVLTAFLQREIGNDNRPTPEYIQKLIEEFQDE